MLEILINSRFDGNQAEFGRAIEKSPAQVYQWLSGYRSIGDGMAHHIETKLSLGAGWLDGKEPAAQHITQAIQLVRDPILDDLAVLEKHEAEKWRIRIKAAADERRLDLRAAQEAGQQQGSDLERVSQPTDPHIERRRTHR